MWNDPGIAGEFGGFAPKSWMEFQEFVKGASFFIIEKNDSKQANGKIGWISYYWTRSDYPYLFEIGYAIKPSERRKGYTTEAARLIVDLLFTSKNIERVESVTDTENLASQRVLEKNGFKREGRLRKRSLRKDEYRDEFIYGLIREEWKQNKQIT